MPMVELSKFVKKFLSEDGTIEVECIRSRFNKGLGNGLELPVELCSYLRANIHFVIIIMTFFGIL